MKLKDMMRSVSENTPGGMANFYDRLERIAGDHELVGPNEHLEVRYLGEGKYGPVCVPNQPEQPQPDYKLTYKTQTPVQPAEFVTGGYHKPEPVHDLLAITESHVAEMIADTIKQERERLVRALRKNTHWALREIADKLEGES